MKECDIFRGRVKTYSDPHRYFRGLRLSNAPVAEIVENLWAVVSPPLTPLGEFTAFPQTT